MSKEKESKAKTWLAAHAIVVGGLWLLVFAGVSTYAYAINESHYLAEGVAAACAFLLFLVFA